MSIRFASRGYGKYESNRRNYIILEKTLLQDPRLSLEGKGMYAELEAGVLELKDVPPHIIDELKEVGYLVEVSE